MLHVMLLLLPSFLIALTVHEFSHAATATLFGDPTPRRMGRLTLNPLAHIDLLGLLCLLLIRIGWARPVIFNPTYFRYPKVYAVLTALAGPCSNFFLVWLSYAAISYFHPMGWVFLNLKIMAYINTMLGVFNLMPIPPLDGGHLLDALFIDRAPMLLLWIRRYGLFLILILFYLPATRAFFVHAIAIAEYAIASLVPRGV